MLVPAVRRGQAGRIVNIHEDGRLDVQFSKGVDLKIGPYDFVRCKPPSFKIGDLVQIRPSERRHWVPGDKDVGIITKMESLSATHRTANVRFGNSLTPDVELERLVHFVPADGRTPRRSNNEHQAGGRLRVVGVVRQVLADMAEIRQTIRLMHDRIAELSRSDSGLPGNNSQARQDDLDELRRLTSTVGAAADAIEDQAKRRDPSAPSVKSAGLVFDLASATAKGAGTALGKKMMESLLDTIGDERLQILWESLGSLLKKAASKIMGILGS